MAKASRSVASVWLWEAPMVPTTWMTATRNGPTVAKKRLRGRPFVWSCLTRSP